MAEANTTVKRELRKDIAGQRIGSLVAVRFLSSTPAPHYRQVWEFRCDCGKVVTRRKDAVSGDASCGCQNGTKISKGKTRHGHKSSTKQSIEYSTWKAMLTRCTNPNHMCFANYGGRGITVCERWRTFANFYADMGPRPSVGHSIDRIDSDGNYEPGNCRWATRLEQNRNKRRRT